MKDSNEMVMRPTCRPENSSNKGCLKTGWEIPTQPLTRNINCFRTIETEGFTRPVDYADADLAAGMLEEQKLGVR